MPKFRYHALDSKGRLIKTDIEAGSLEEAKDKILRNTDLTLIRLVPKKALEISLSDLFIRVDDQSLAIVNRQLSILNRVGVSLDRALSTVAKHITNRALYQALQSCAIDVSRGTTFSLAMSKHPRIFTPLSVAMVKAGEGSGTLADMLDMLADLQEREYRNKKRLQAAMSYPLFVITVSLLAVFAMTMFFVPNFIGIYENMRLELPMMTKFLIGFTSIFMSPTRLLIIIVIILILIFVTINYFRTPQGKYTRDRLRIKIPFIGNVIQKSTMSRFCATLSTLYASGIPLANCLTIMIDFFDDSLLKDAMRHCTKEMKSGSEMSQKLREFPHIPKAVADLIAVGEESGEMKKLLDKLAEILELDATYAAESLWKLLEPATILVLALAVTFIMLSVFLPLYQLIMTL
ncbi:MAG: type II secretion system F family protein [Candidatus Eremiobacteraeota bacterium]|nr:type II secretion system F family protein [Candidatus Eremiobacteraeota bacterium]